MTSPELENLVRTGKLKRELLAAGEIDGLRRSGEARLADAQRLDLSIESRFDLAYNAAHVLALAALRRLGYRFRESLSRVPDVASYSQHPSLDLESVGQGS